MRVTRLRIWGALAGVGVLVAMVAMLAVTLTGGGGLARHETGASVARADRVLQGGEGLTLANWSVSAIFNDGNDSATIELAIDAQGAEFVVIDAEGIQTPDARRRASGGSRGRRGGGCHPPLRRWHQR